MNDFESYFDLKRSLIHLDLSSFHDQTPVLIQGPRLNVTLTQPSIATTPVSCRFKNWSALSRYQRIEQLETQVEEQSQRRERLEAQVEELSQQTERLVDQVEEESQQRE